MNHGIHGRHEKDKRKRGKKGKKGQIPGDREYKKEGRPQNT
jgi:hypothetical protein